MLTTILTRRRQPQNPCLKIVINIAHFLDVCIISSLWKELSFALKHEVFSFSSCYSLDGTPKHSRSKIFMYLPCLCEKWEFPAQKHRQEKS